MPRRQDAGRLSLSLGREDTLTIGRDGWAVFVSPDLESDVFVRFADTQDGFRVIEVRVLGDVTGEDLRAVPLGRLEAAINRPGLGKSIRWRFEEGREVGPGVWGRAEQQGATERKTRASVDEALKAPIRLRVPTSRRYPDSFYERVAAAYSFLTAAGEAAAPAIAEANGVPETTVHRWVKEARRRDLLAGGQRGTGGGS